jgi:hypothetical protein
MGVKKDDPASRPDEDNPEWTAEDFADARPASEVLPQFIGQAATDALTRLSRERSGKPGREKKRP